MTAEAETGRLKGFDASRADDPEQLFGRAPISEAFARLHRSHRELIYRAYYLRWTTGQIAADLNVTEPVVKCGLHYALPTFRSALTTHGHPGKGLNVSVIACLVWPLAYGR